MFKPITAENVLEKLQEYNGPVRFGKLEMDFLVTKPNQKARLEKVVAKLCSTGKARLSVGPSAATTLFGETVLRAMGLATRENYVEAV